MHINTSRFGTVAVKPDDVVNFASGLIGYETCKQWVLMADAESDCIGWLQCVHLPEVAMAVISPRRFLPDYHVRVSRNQLTALDLNGVDQAFVLNILAMNAGRLTVNLRAPVLINLNRRLGRQLITNDEQPVQFELSAGSLKLRKAA
jgi:flagellar assembly factor FliW